MPFAISPSEVLTAAGLLVTGAVAWGTVRTTVRQHAERIETLEADVVELKESQLAVALLEQTTQNFKTAVEGIVDEAKLTRQTMETMGRSLVRIETQLALEGRPVPGLSK